METGRVTSGCRNLSVDFECESGENHHGNAIADDEGMCVNITMGYVLEDSGSDTEELSGKIIMFRKCYSLNFFIEIHS